MDDGGVFFIFCIFEIIFDRLFEYVFLKFFDLYIIIALYIKIISKIEESKQTRPTRQNIYFSFNYYFFFGGNNTHRIRLCKSYALTQ